MSEKATRILEVLRNLINIYKLRPNKSLNELERSDFGISEFTKQFEEKIKEDLNFVEKAHEEIKYELEAQRIYKKWIEMVIDITYI